MDYYEVLGWIALVLMAIALPIFIIWAVVQWVNFFRTRKKDSTKIRILANSQTALYILFSIVVISGVIINIYGAINSSGSTIMVILIAIGAFLGGIGLIALIFEVAKRWHILGGLMFLVIGLLPFAELVFKDFAEHTLANYPSIITAVAFVLFASLVLSGIIIMIKGNNFDSQSKIVTLAS